MAALSLSLQRTATMAAARPQLQAALQFPRLRTLLPELSALVGGWLLRAVPKKKTSHSRKSMRSANKGIARKSSGYLQPEPRSTGLLSPGLAKKAEANPTRTDLSHCEGCGQPKMTHHLCLFCYSKSNRFFKFLANPDKARPMLPESSNGAHVVFRDHAGYSLIGWSLLSKQHSPSGRTQRPPGTVQGSRRQRLSK